MKYSNIDKENTNIYDQPIVSQVPYGAVAPRPGRGVFGLFISVAIVFVIIIVFLFPTLFGSNNDDVSYSGLGINNRYYKQGDWIYFATRSFSSYSEGLWRVRSDGKEKEKIIDSKVDLFTYYGNQILYITHSDNNDWILHTVDTEGNNDKILYQSNDDSSLITKMDATYGGCYALDINNRLYFIELDSGEVSEFSDEVSDFCIDGGWIYYIKRNPDNDEKLFQLWRTDIGGTQNDQLMSSFECAVDYSDNKIYYINEENGYIYSVGFSGEKEQKIIESDGGHYIKIIGDWIFYENQGSNSGIYKVKKNGRDNQRVSDFEARVTHKHNIEDPLLSMRAVSILDNWFWYYDISDTSTSLCKMIRIGETHKTDYVIEDILDNTYPAHVIRKFE